MGKSQVDKLTSEQKKVLREKATEPPFSGALLYNKEAGEYCCAECGNVVFTSEHKFDSRSGWLAVQTPRCNTKPSTQNNSSKRHFSRQHNEGYASSKECRLYESLEHFFSIASERLHCGFYDVAQSDAVTLKEDTSHDMQRTEVACAKCGGHLGHLFDDAVDQPTGKRYCINSLALTFQPDKKGEPNE